MTPTRLACTLSLTGLPVALTGAALRYVGMPKVGALATSLRSPFLDFAVYAAANWITFAVIVQVVGWSELRALGLRFPFSIGRGVAAVGGFVIGVGVYAVVAAALRRLDLPPIQGMDYAAPSAAELTVLFASVVLTAAVCEEIFFRVLWVGSLRRLLPAWLAGAIAIVAFAVIHFPYFGIGGVIFISVWAILPVALFLAFGDLTASVLMHVLNNTFAYLVVPLLLRRQS